MLREERVSRAHYDAQNDELSLECGSALPGGAKERTVSGNLLLDKAGFLVGVDVGEEPDRVVVMMGRHEDVDRTRDVRVRVRGSSVVVSDAKREARAHEKNPYGP